MNRRIAGIAGGVVVVLVAGLYYFTRPTQTDPPDTSVEPEMAEEVIEAEPNLLFGIDADAYKIVEGKIKRNQTIADILAPYNVSRQEIFELDRRSSDVFSVRNFIPRKEYTVFYNDDSIKSAAYFVYEPNDLEYVVYQLKDSIDIYKVERDVEIVEQTMAGRITVSLDHAIRQNGGSAALVSKVADVFGWRLDFRRLQVGDWFKVVYEEKLVDGKSIGVGEVIGAEFNHVKNSYMAYAFGDDGALDYYDENGESLQRAFLRYPVEYSRISSRYNPRRFHPVLKRRTPHLGTDYAAAKGTPIKAAADGVIINKGYTKGNGNYIKIRHNGTYTTGYLHMSKFAKVKNGQRVRKGQVIGYVGKTGLATGYHLCFRFWKRGKQVDFLREKLPAEKPIEGELLPRFEAKMELVTKKLNDISTPWAENNLSAINR